MSKVSIKAKICGLNEQLGVDAAIQAGASYIGLVFFPPSPRALTIEEAKKLTFPKSSDTNLVGLFVDAEDDLIDSAMNNLKLNMLQLHGSETPERVITLKKRTGCTVMKVISVAVVSDLTQAEKYFDAADWLMFDAKPPTDTKDSLPGGNARNFDWSLLSGSNWPLPWMLAGGLNYTNVAEAVSLTGAKVVDCSSGVEDRPGCKNPDKVTQFMSAVHNL